MRDLKSMQALVPASRWMRGRVVVLGAVLLALLGAIFVRAVQLQVHQKDRLLAFAEEQYVRDLKIPGRRGDIFDRRHVPLAQSVDVDSVWVDPSTLSAPKALAQKVGRVLSIDSRELLERFAKGRRFAWVKRAVTPSEMARLKAMGLSELRTVKEPRRFYPQREVAAHLIGLVGTDAHGLDGLEKSFEDELSGNLITREGVRDARGHKLLPNGVEDPLSREGAALTLTINRQLQYVSEKALEQAVVDAQATAGMVVMTDPKTGEVLALASTPGSTPTGHETRGLPRSATGRSPTSSSRGRPSRRLSSPRRSTTGSSRRIPASSAKMARGPWERMSFTIPILMAHSRLAASSRSARTSAPPRWPRSWARSASRTPSSALASASGQRSASRERARVACPFPKPR